MRVCLQMDNYVHIWVTRNFLFRHGILNISIPSAVFLCFFVACPLKLVRGSSVWDVAPANVRNKTQHLFCTIGPIGCLKVTGRIMLIFRKNENKKTDSSSGRKRLVNSSEVLRPIYSRLNIKTTWRNKRN